MDTKEFILSNSASIRDVLELINHFGMPGVSIFIINENSQIVGSVTDGDIRRGLLRGAKIEDSVEIVMNRSFKCVIEGHDNFLKIKDYKSKDIRFVPLLAENMELRKILDLEKFDSMIPVDAILMAGGKGERLKPLTDNVPKPMLKVGDKPILRLNMERLIRFGVSNFNISIRHLGEQIMAGVSEWDFNDINISFIKESTPLGTIGSVGLLKSTRFDTVLLMNSDLLTNIDYQDFYEKFLESGADMQVATIPYYVDVPYAVMNINENNEVISFTEKPRYTYYSNAGIYLFRKSLIDLIPKEGPYDATQFMDAIINEGLKLNSYPIMSYWLDIGRLEDYYKAQKDFENLKF